MGLNKLNFAVLALGCLAAAGLGGYLAGRQDNGVHVESATTAPLDVAAPAADAPRAVAESEGVITPTPEAPAAPVRTAEAPEANAPRREAPARRTPAPSPVPVTSASRSARNATTTPAPRGPRPHRLRPARCGSLVR